MTGIFTYRNFSLKDTPSLEGQVAVVTGGQAGIGQEITAQLLLHGIAKVFVLARTKNKFDTACEEWRNREGLSLGMNDDRVQFIPCDLADIKNVKAATEQIKQNIDHIHILICNAGLGVPPEYKLSPQGIDWVFAANVVGHQVLITLLLPLLQKAVPTAPNGVRVVITSSGLHAVCRQLDVNLLATPSRIKWPPVLDSVWRYGRSKLGNILLAKELSRRLLQEDREPASTQIYVNSFFPGNIVTNQWSAWNIHFGPLFGFLMRALGSCYGQSAEDGAATALYLAASGEVREKNLRGQYFIPIAEPCDPSPLGTDMELGQHLWDWIEAKATETLGEHWESEH